MLFPAVSPAVRALLAETLDTFEKLEIAIALQRAPLHSLSIEELVRAIGNLARDQIEHGVAELVAAGVCSATLRIVRLTPTPTDAPTYAALVEQYDRDHAAIAQAISEVAMEKIRGMAARTFAEAFHATRKRGDNE